MLMAKRPNVSQLSYRCFGLKYWSHSQQVEVEEHRWGAHSKIEMKRVILVWIWHMLCTAALYCSLNCSRHLKKASKHTYTHTPLTNLQSAILQVLYQSTTLRMTVHEIQQLDHVQTSPDCCTITTHTSTHITWVSKFNLLSVILDYRISWISVLRPLFLLPLQLFEHSMFES